VAAAAAAAGGGSSSSQAGLGGGGGSSSQAGLGREGSVATSESQAESVLMLSMIQWLLRNRNGAEDRILRRAEWADSEAFHCFQIRGNHRNATERRLRHR
jgi:hypothetical protein